MGPRFAVLNKLINKLFQVKLVPENYFHNNVFIPGNAIAIDHFLQAFHMFQKGFEFTHKSPQGDDGFELITEFGM